MDNQKQAAELQEAIAAIQNLLGVFDTPIARAKVGGPIAEEAIKTAHEVVDAYLLQARAQIRSAKACDELEDLLFNYTKK